MLQIDWPPTAPDSPILRWREMVKKTKIKGLKKGASVKRSETIDELLAVATYSTWGFEDGSDPRVKPPMIPMIPMSSAYSAYDAYRSLAGRWRSWCSRAWCNLLNYSPCQPDVHAFCQSQVLFWRDARNTWGLNYHHYLSMQAENDSFLLVRFHKKKCRKKVPSKRQTLAIHRTFSPYRTMQSKLLRMKLNEGWWRLAVEGVEPFDFPSFSSWSSGKRGWSPVLGPQRIHVQQDSRNLQRTEGRRYAQIPFGRTSALRSKERKSSLKILRQRI